MTTELRCSPAIRGLGVEPIGSAPAGASYLLIDLPLPWQHDLSVDPRLAELLALVGDLGRQGHPWSVQATVPLQADEHRIVAYQVPAERLLTGYRRREVRVGAGDEVGRAMALLQELAEQPIGAASAGELDALAGDLLLCTHGARDVCCGGPGTALWKDLTDRLHVLPDHVTLGRTSHTGGHRFAPTAILLPEGTVWAWLDAAVVHAVTQRNDPIDAVLPHYRGSCFLSSVAEQVVELEVLRQVGWDWFATPRRGSSQPTDVDGESLVELHYAQPDGRAGTWSARTRVVGRTPVPQCGQPVADAPKFAPLVEVVGEVEHRPG